MLEVHDCYTDLLTEHLK